MKIRLLSSLRLPSLRLPRFACLGVACVGVALTLGGALAGPAAAGETKLGDVRALFATALEYQAQGRTRDARRLHAEILEVDPDHRAARRALGFVHVDGAWIKRTSAALARTDARAPEGVPPSAASRVDAARPQASTLRPALRRASLLEALHEGRTPSRRRAAQALGAHSCEEARRALLHAALHDVKRAVRTAAAESLVAFADRKVAQHFVAALASRTMRTRIRAADALAKLGDRRALPYLVRRWEVAGGEAPRGYFTQVNQVSYIQDFDTEVASTSFIADPIIGTLQSGVVQDVRVLSSRGEISVVERLAYQRALAALVGKDVGSTPRAWRRWLDAQRVASVEFGAPERDGRARGPSVDP